MQIRRILLMKSFLLLMIGCIFYCKKAQGNSLNKNVSQEVNLDKNWTGDMIISDLSFVKSINTSCKLDTPFFGRSDKKIKEDNTKCVLSKIKYDYSKLNSLQTKTFIGSISPEIKLFIKKHQQEKIKDADLAYQTYLYIEKNKIISDSIIIYESINYSEALTVKNRYYYINKEKIYLLDFVEDESGSSVEKWSEHKIDLNGKISLIKQEIITNQNTSIKSDNNSWEGIYWLYPYDLNSQKVGNYYVNFFNDNKEFGFSGENEFNYKINYNSVDNKLYIFDLDDASSKAPLAIIYKDKDKYYIKSNLIKLECSDIKETKNGYQINWAKSSDDVPDSPQ